MQVDAVFKHFDPNGEGSVDYGEFMWAFFNRRSLLSKWRSDATTKGGARAKMDRMKSLFYRFDEQRRGKLMPRQFKKVIKVCWGMHDFRQHSSSPCFVVWTVAFVAGVSLF